METIDINKVAGLQALDAEGNVLGVVSMEQLTDMVAGKLATELAAQNTAPAMRTMSLTASPAAASVAATGVDKTEGQLGDVTDPGYVRVLDKSGNSGKQGIEQFASVVGGLIGVLKSRNNIGLYGSIKDFDQATQIGYYTLVGSNDNSILNKCGIDYGLMIYIDGAGNKRYGLQYAFDMFKKKIAYRMTDTNGIWQEWAIFNATT